MQEYILTILSILGTISGIYIGWSVKSRQSIKDAEEKASRDAILTTNMGYINTGMENLAKQIEKILTSQQEYIDKNSDVIRLLTDRVVGDENDIKLVQTDIKNLEKRIDKIEDKIK